jgi:protein-S-isoprenylcysteine O-methyltransferase Ste14
VSRRIALSFLIAISMVLSAAWSRHHPAAAVVELVLLHLFFLADVQVRPAVVGADEDRPGQVLASKAYMAGLVYLPLLTSAGYGLAVAPLLGLALTVLGALVTLCARVELGGMGTETLVIVPDHRLHTRGLYRLIRHPIYCGFSLAFLGHQVAFRSLPGLLLWALFTVHIIHRRIRREEEMLLRHFGDRYQRYMQATWRMFPCLY